MIVSSVRKLRLDAPHRCLRLRCVALALGAGFVRGGRMYGPRERFARTKRSANCRYIRYLGDKSRRSLPHVRRREPE